MDFMYLLCAREQESLFFPKMFVFCSKLKVQALRRVLKLTFQNFGVMCTSHEYNILKNMEICE